MLVKLDVKAVMAGKVYTESVEINTMDDIWYCKLRILSKSILYNLEREESWTDDSELLQAGRAT